MIGIEIVEDPSTRQPSPARTRQVLDMARDRGLLLLRAGTHDNVVRLLVPLVATGEGGRGGGGPVVVGRCSGDAAKVVISQMHGYDWLHA